MNVLVSVFANGPEVSKCSYHDLTQGRVNRLRPGKREKVLLPGIHHIDELLDQAIAYWEGIPPEQRDYDRAKEEYMRRTR